MVVLVYHVAIVCALVFMADVSAVVVSAIISINITASVLVVVSVFGVAFLLNVVSGDCFWCCGRSYCCCCGHCFRYVYVYVMMVMIVSTVVVLGGSQ